MIRLDRSVTYLVILWAMSPAMSQAQDVPLYRDPSPMEGPRIEGPLLAPIPARPVTPPPPTTGLGPFQPANPDMVGPAIEPAREPLLGVNPIPPPLPAFIVPPSQAYGDVQIKRTTTIRPPAVPIGRCHDWFRETLFGARTPSSSSTVTVANSPRRGFLARCFHPDPAESEPQPRWINWPSWPTWPLSGDR